jgi:hypothetical protein
LYSPVSSMWEAIASASGSIAASISAWYASRA